MAMSDEDNWIYAAGPDGQPMAFANEAELEAYRRARREAEPPLLRCLRKHRAEVGRLEEQAKYALEQRRDRSGALAAIQTRLHSLLIAMGDDIVAAARETARQEREPKR
jgi:hypothetical protein